MSLTILFCLKVCWTKHWKHGPSSSNSFSTFCQIHASLQSCFGREQKGSSLSNTQTKLHDCGERETAEGTWPTRSLVEHCVITTTRKFWPRFVAGNTRTSSTFMSLKGSIKAYHFPQHTSPLTTPATRFPPLVPGILTFSPLVLPCWCRCHTATLLGYFLIPISSLCSRIFNKKQLVNA